MIASYCKFSNSTGFDQSLIKGQYLGIAWARTMGVETGTVWATSWTTAKARVPRFAQPTHVSV